MPAIYSIVSGSSEIKTKGFSVLRVGNNIGWGIGPAIGGFAVYSSGFYYLFLSGFLFSAVALVISFLLTDVRMEGSTTLPLHTENTLLIYLSVVAMLLFMVQAQETVTLSNYANIIRGLNYFQLGLIYLVNGVVVIATQGLVYRIIRRIGNYASFIIGSLVYSGGFFSFALVSNLTGMLISTAILTIGEDFAFPASSAMVSLVSRPENIGRNMGIYNAFISGGRASGPVVGGAVLSLTSMPLEIWGLVTASGFISTVLFVAAFRKQSVIQEEAVADP
jgi:MFS family permease